MLTTLRIKNLALVTDLTLELQPGCNVITGETGFAHTGAEGMSARNPKFSTKLAVRNTMPTEDDVAIPSGPSSRSKLQNWTVLPIVNDEGRNFFC